MISSLRGKVDRVWGNSIEIEVAGVGYLVWVGKKNYSEGQEIKIFTYMAVSENDVALYGFENFEDLDLFKMLITVSGVGPKSGAQILGAASAEALASRAIIKAIGDADTSFFEKIKGVGKKTAQRIIVDLKSKINNQNLDMSAFAGGSGEIKEDDVVLSLRQLGFERKEIESVIKKLPNDLSVLEDKVSWCLQNLAR